MKVLACIALFVLLGVGANGQQVIAGKALAETSVLSEKVVKGSPFTADAVNESVQVLADGNRIVRSSTNKLYRNTEGRFRREMSGGSGGALGSFYSVGPGITILDPVAGHRYLLDSQLRTARIGTLAPTAALTTGQGKALSAATQAAMAERRAVESRATTPRATIASDDRNVEVAVVKDAEVKLFAETAKVYAETAKAYGQTVATAPGNTFVYTTGSPKYETRTENLGVQNIEGVEAEGVRTVTTIPAGDIGNERPIEMIYERWYSKDLQLVVMSRNIDPRFGEQTYRLTNIVRNEPDPSLFEVPSGFKVLAEPAVSYTIRSNVEANGSGQNVVWTKTSSTAKGATSTTPAKP